MTEFIEVSLTPEQVADREAYAAGAYQREYDQVTANRQAGYATTSDPIFMQSRSQPQRFPQWQAQGHQVCFGEYVPVNTRRLRLAREGKHIPRRRQSR